MSVLIPRIAGHNEHSWALVLGAGEGKRLRSLTTDARGVAVPKQFCSLAGERSLLHDALIRARTVASPAHTCAIVAADHQRWWEPSLRSLPQENIIVQPDNRGTAIGILLPLAVILRRDPDATLLVLPSDHFVRNEAILSRAISAAMSQAQGGEVVLLGIDPEEADTELGYIVPDQPCGDDVQQVASFVEKPQRREAEQTIDAGGLWNSFIFAARGATLFAMLERALPDDAMQLVELERRVAEGDAAPRELADLYQHLPTVDFSREVLQQLPGLLRVMRVPACGWSDLGTPRRVTDVLRRERPRIAPDPVTAGGVLNLAAQHALLQLA